MFRPHVGHHLANTEHTKVYKVCIQWDPIFILLKVKMYEQLVKIKKIGNEWIVLQVFRSLDIQKQSPDITLDIRSH
jgi:hypothetical protein